ncbi:MAG: DUF2202 domain-containing protein [Draconibacterium sp.]
MKAKNAFLMVAGLALIAGACSKSDDPVTDPMFTDEKSSEIAAAICDSCTYDGELTEADFSGLLAMREEEKLAHDVYVTFFSEYSAAVFQNIANSEEAHMAAILNLINGYGLEDPAIDGVGNFSNPLFAGLFVSLTEQGGASLEAALKTGAYIEELDIADLMAQLENTKNEDIQRVYGNLLAGSESHLRAFVNNLAAMGVTYAPELLDDATFAAIMSGQNGRRGQRNGNGYQGANGKNGAKGSNGQNGNGTGICDGTQSGVSNSGQNGNGNNR